jgi:hypothetical protein
MADHPINDYYVITSLRVGHPDRWSWEIRRKSKPLGIKMTEMDTSPTRPRNLRGSKRWRNFWPSYRKKKNAHGSKAASVGGLFRFSLSLPCRSLAPFGHAGAA